MTSRVMKAAKLKAVSKGTAKVKGKRITAKQKAARVKNIAIARKHKKKGAAKGSKSKAAVHKKNVLNAMARGYWKGKAGIYEGKASKSGTGLSRATINKFVKRGLLKSSGWYKGKRRYGVTDKGAGWIESRL